MANKLFPELRFLMFLSVPPNLNGRLPRATREILEDVGRFVADKFVSDYKLTRFVTSEDPCAIISMHTIQKGMNAEEYGVSRLKALNPKETDLASATNSMKHWLHAQEAAIVLLHNNFNPFSRLPAEIIRTIYPSAKRIPRALAHRYKPTPFGRMLWINCVEKITHTVHPQQL